MMMPSQNLPDYSKRFNNYEDLPVNAMDTYNRPSHRYQPGRPVTPPPGCDLRVYERYLREKWRCADTMPEVFDPNRLEDRVRSQYPPRSCRRETPNTKTERRQQRPLGGGSSSGVEQDEPTSVVDSRWKPLPSIPFPTNGVSAESVSVVPIARAGAGAGGELRAQYESDVTNNALSYARRHADAINSSRGASDATTRAPTASTRDVIDRQPTPRIKTGSKPPLSKSAYANANSSRSSSSTARPRAPRYFPFRSRMAAGKR